MSQYYTENSLNLAITNIDNMYYQLLNVLHQWQQPFKLQDMLGKYYFPALSLTYKHIQNTYSSIFIHY